MSPKQPIDEELPPPSDEWIANNSTDESGFIDSSSPSTHELPPIGQLPPEYGPGVNVISGDETIVNLDDENFSAELMKILEGDAQE